MPKASQKTEIETASAPPYISPASAIKGIEKALGDANVLVYVSTGHMGNWDILPLYQRLEKMGKCECLVLILDSYGGYTETAYKIADVIHEFCQNVKILVPGRAKSAATLLCLSAIEIQMGPISELGPTDPMLDVPEELITPQLPKAQAETGSKPQAKNRQMNAHALQDFLEAAGIKKAERKEYDPDILAKYMEKGILNPWLLGDFERSTKKAKQFAEQLLLRYMFRDNKEKQALIPDISSKLCTGFYDHGYPIGRREARDLGLEVIDMSPALWKMTSELLTAYETIMAAQNIRTIIESKTDYFVAHWLPVSS